MLKNRPGWEEVQGQLRRQLRRVGSKGLYSTSTNNCCRLLLVTMGSIFRGLQRICIHSFVSWLTGCYQMRGYKSFVTPWRCFPQLKVKHWNHILQYVLILSNISSFILNSSSHKSFSIFINTFFSFGHELICLKEKKQARWKQEGIFFFSAMFYTCYIMALYFSQIIILLLSDVTLKKEMV